MIMWLYFFIALIISVMVHELGHLFTALICKVNVEAFSIGFGKPLWHKKVKGIDFRFAPILLGGYVKLAGETDKRPNGLLSQPYLKKVFIILSGVTMNFILACICYLLLYKSILVGISIDWSILKAVVCKDLLLPYQIMASMRPNLFLLQLSLINFGCAILNIMPFPALDGGLLWMAWLEKITPNYEQIIKNLSAFGFLILLLLQLLLILYLLC